MTRVVLQGRLAKAIKARVVKPKPKPAAKDDTVIVDRDKLDPAYDPYRHNTRSITAAN